MGMIWNDIHKQKFNADTKYKIATYHLLMSYEAVLYLIILFLIYYIHSSL